MKFISNHFKENKYFLKKIAFTSLSRGLSATGTFLLNVVLAKTLSIEDYGNYMLVYAMMIGSSFLVNFGMPTAILRFASILYENGDIIQIEKLKIQAFKLLSGLSVLVISVTLISMKFISNTFFSTDVTTLIILFCLALPIYSLTGIQSSFIKAYKRPEIAPFFEVGLSAFTTSLIVTLLDYFDLMLITKEVVGIAFLGSQTILIILGYLKIISIEKKEFLVTRNIKSQKFYNSLPDYATLAIITYLVKFSPILILGYFATEDKVALYSLTNSITFIIGFIAWIIGTVYSPTYANLYADNHIKKLKRVLKQSTTYMMIIAIPIYIIIVTSPSSILEFFSKGYTHASLGLQILATGQLINIITGPVYFLMNMTGHQKKLRNIAVVTSTISIGIAFMLIPKYGFMGAIWSGTFSLVFQNILAFYYTRKVLKIKAI